MDPAVTPKIRHHKRRSNRSILEEKESLNIVLRQSEARLAELGAAGSERLRERLGEQRPALNGRAPPLLADSNEQNNQQELLRENNSRNNNRMSAAPVVPPVDASHEMHESRERRRLRDPERDSGFLERPDGRSEFLEHTELDSGSSLFETNVSSADSSSSTLTPGGRVPDGDNISLASTTSSLSTSSIATTDSSTLSDAAKRQSVSSLSDLEHLGEFYFWSR